MLEDDVEGFESSNEAVARYWDAKADLWTEHIRRGWDAYREHYKKMGQRGVGVICSAGPLWRSKEHSEACEGCSIFWEFSPSWGCPASFS